MKPLSIILLAIVFLITGFIAGLFFSNLSAKQNVAADKEHLTQLIELHDYQRKRSKEVSLVSGTILKKIGPLIDDGTIASKGKVSEDPLKKLLWESYHCISGSLGVIDNYEHVYVTDSTFIARYFKLE